MPDSDRAGDKYARHAQPILLSTWPFDPAVRSVGQDSNCAVDLRVSQRVRIPANPDPNMVTQELMTGFVRLERIRSTALRPPR